MIMSLIVLNRHSCSRHVSAGGVMGVMWGVMGTA